MLTVSANPLPIQAYHLYDYLDNRHCPMDNFVVLIASYFSHGYKLFGGGWMNTNGLIKMGFGGSRFHGDCQALNNFSRILTHHMATNYPIRLAVDNQFHKRAFVDVGEGVL